MRINVTRFYQDIHNRKVEVGEYDIDDKRLKGMGQWFVDNGFADVIEGEDLEDDYAPEFTSHALALLDESNFSPADMLDYVEDNNIEQVKKSDVQDWLDSLG